MRVMQGCATRNKGGIPQVVNPPYLLNVPRPLEAAKWCDVTASILHWHGEERARVVSAFLNNAADLGPPFCA